jgi:2-amino-4,5-dihydroxy-6-oxo-7-(phosphooxy)heptanoate synthase
VVTLDRPLPDGLFAAGGTGLNRLVGQSATNSADAVSVHVNIGSREEARQITDMAQVAVHGDVLPPAPLELRVSREALA